MLVYPNKYFFRILVAVGGSVLLRAAPVGAMCTVVTGVVQFLIDDEWLDENLDNSYVFSQFGWLLAFALVFRTNIAWGRYWSACLDTATMYSKWEDVMITLSAFFQVGTGNHEHDIEKIKYLWTMRRKITHWMSMMSATVMHEIMHGRTSLIHELSWKAAIVPAQDVKSMMPVEHKLPSFGMILPLDFPLASKAKEPAYGSSEKLNYMKKFHAENEVSDFVLDEVTPEERLELEASTSPVETIACWVLATLSRVHCVTNPVPAPIYSRVYQELSNGMLGYKRAKMLTDVNFPLPYAQLLQWMLVLFMICCPISIIRFTGTSSFLSPVMTFLVVTGFWAMNEMAVELENPFGEDANDVPLSDQHEAFIELLFSLYLTSVPEDSVSRGDAAGEIPETEWVVSRDPFFSRKPPAKLKEPGSDVPSPVSGLAGTTFDVEEPEEDLTAENLASLEARLENMTQLLESVVPALEKLPGAFEEVTDKLKYVGVKPQQKPAARPLLPCCGEVRPEVVRILPAAQTTSQVQASSRG